MLRMLLACLVDDALRGLSGPLGVRLRRAWYRRRLKRCGARLVIEPGVHIVRPDCISLGDDVWLDRQAVLIAGPPDPNAHIEVRENRQARVAPGEIVIGDGAHLGIGSIIQGHGGIEIGRGFTTSPHAKVYSFSNDHRRCHSGTTRAGGATQSYLLTPVLIGDNVWIGINAVVVGHTIGSDTFIKPGSVVASSVPANSIVAGVPGRRVEARFDKAVAGSAA